MWLKAWLFPGSGRPICRRKHFFSGQLVCILVVLRYDGLASQAEALRGGNGCSQMI